MALMTATGAWADRIDDAIKQIDELIEESHKIDLKNAYRFCKDGSLPYCEIYRILLREEKRRLMELKKRQGTGKKK